MMRFDLMIGPQPIQDRTTGNFPFYLGCRVRVRATGMIWSGVVCTGLTPPGGWGGAPVAEHETDWPCRGPQARRYELIGSFDGMTWFPVGDEVTKFSTEPRAGAGPTARLRLAVNRPSLDSPAAGDREWTVQVETFEPGMSGLDPETCRAVQAELAMLRTVNAPNACEELTRARAALNARQEQVVVAFEIAGALAISLTSVAVAPFIPAAVAEHGASMAGLRALLEILKRALETISSVVGVIVTGITTIAALMTARSAGTAARSAASPLNANPIMAAVIAGLIIATLAAFAVAIGLLLSLLTLGAEYDNALSHWHSTVNAVQTLLGYSRVVCPPPFDETLPTCHVLEG